MIKKCGMIFRRTKSKDILRIETWKLNLLNIIQAIHHARKPKARKPVPTAAQKIIHHAGQVKVYLEKLENQEDLSDDEKHMVREHIKTIV